MYGAVISYILPKIHISMISDNFSIRSRYMNTIVVIDIKILTESPKI